MRQFCFNEVLSYNTAGNLCFLLKLYIYILDGGTHPSQSKPSYVLFCVFLENIFQELLAKYLGVFVICYYLLILQDH